MVKIIVGLMGSSVQKGSDTVSDPEKLREFLACVKKHGVKEIDTARVYNGGKSEETIGAVEAYKTFAVSTKAPGFRPGALTEENILSNAAKSLAALRQDKVDIYYIHGPDRETPLEEQLHAMNQLHQEGKYERFGVSNLSDAEVQKVYDICKKEGYVMPSVYQGGYNPISRGAENTLFPLLRKLNMNFYAFSPMAGGLLAKRLKDIQNPAPGTRYAEMKFLGDMFLNKETVGAIEKLQQVCDDNDIPLMEATLRWIMNHSPLNDEDGLILGAASTAQIDSSLTAAEKGPLPEVLVKQFAETWEATQNVNTRYHS